MLPAGGPSILTDWAVFISATAVHGQSSDISKGCMSASLTRFPRSGLDSFLSIHPWRSSESHATERRSEKFGHPVPPNICGQESVVLFDSGNPVIEHKRGGLEIPSGSLEN